MQRTEIEVKVKGIIESKLGFKDGQVNNTDRFVDDLGADSLDHVEICMGMEEEFGIEIEDEAADNIKTVQEAIDLIVEKAA